MVLLYATPNRCVSSRACCKIFKDDLFLGITTGLFFFGTKTSSFSLAKEIHGSFKPRDSRDFMAAFSCPLPPSITIRSVSSEFYSSNL